MWIAWIPRSTGSCYRADPEYQRRWQPQLESGSRGLRFPRSFWQVAHKKLKPNNPTKCPEFSAVRGCKAAVQFGSLARTSGCSRSKRRAKATSKSTKRQSGCRCSTKSSEERLKLASKLGFCMRAKTYLQFLASSYSLLNFHQRTHYKFLQTETQRFLPTFPWRLGRYRCYSYILVS